MKLIAKFSIPGEAYSKQRARVVNGGAYTPDITVEMEAKARLCFMNEARGYEPLPAPRGRYRLMLAFVACNRSARDVDNMAKLVMDALNGVAWTDDSQIDELSIRRVWVSDPKFCRTDVEIYELPNPLEPRTPPRKDRAHRKPRFPQPSPPDKED